MELSNMPHETHIAKVKSAMEEEEDDPFVFITRQAKVPSSQIQLLRTLRFLHDDDDRRINIIPPPGDHLPSLPQEQGQGQEEEEGTQSNVDYESFKKRKLTLGVTPSITTIGDASLPSPTHQQQQHSSGDGDGLNTEAMHASSLQRPPDATNASLRTLPGFRKLPDWSHQFGDGRKQTDSCNSIRSETRLSSSSASRDSVQPSFVSITDLIDGSNEGDILVTAIKAGWNIPRPRFWRS